MIDWRAACKFAHSQKVGSRSQLLGFAGSGGAFTAIYKIYVQAIIEFKKKIRSFPTKRDRIEDYV